LACCRLSSILDVCFEHVQSHRHPAVKRNLHTGSPLEQGSNNRTEGGRESEQASNNRGEAGREREQRRSQ
jgi:hypothetical protein